jgi:hypothetical protein
LNTTVVEMNIEPGSMPSLLRGKAVEIRCSITYSTK